MLLYVGGKAGFNSMKVRLKPKGLYCTIYAVQSFQFHEGPIKTEARRMPIGFHSVSIP